MVILLTRKIVAASAVDAQFTGYCPLAVAGVVPLSYRLFQRQHRSRFVVRQRWRIVAWPDVGRVLGRATLPRPDEQSEEFERADQCQR